MFATAEVLIAGSRVSPSFQRAQLASPSNALTAAATNSGGRVSCAQMQDLAAKTALDSMAELENIEKRLGTGTKIADPGVLHDLLAARKADLVNLMQQNPDDAYRFIVNHDELRDLRKRTDSCVETYSETEGMLEIFHTDYVDGRENTEYRLRSDSGELLNLFSRSNDNLEHRFIISGARIIVKGFKLDNDVLINEDDPQSVLTGAAKRASADWRIWRMSAANAAVPADFGPQSTIVILANFQNTTQPSITPAAAANLIFGNANGTVNSYYLENSYGQTSLTGNVVGWFTMPLNQSCDEAAVESAAIAAADPTVDFTQYAHIIIVAPMNCPGIAGYGSIGPWNVTTADGTLSESVAWIMAPYFSERVVSHEFGHNLGLQHASSISCGSSGLLTPNEPTGCSLYEYGDAYDVMGYSLGQMNAPHKDYIGWFDPSQTLLVDASGTYTLAPLEATTTQLHMLKVQRAFDDYLFIEYRQPIDTDAHFGATSDGVKGALLHIFAGSPNKTWLVDTTANTVGVSLQPGASFTDPLTKTTVTTLAADASSLSAQISLGKTDFISPTVDVTSPTGTYSAPASASGVVSVAANASDGSGILRVEFWRSGDFAPFAVASTTPYTASWNTAKVPNGTNWIYAVAYDASGAVWGVPGNQAASRYQAVDVENTDTIPPSVTLSAPKQGAVVKSPVTITASATDNVGVFQVAFWKTGDPFPMSTKSAPPFSYATTLSAGTYSVYAVARDYVGNTATSAANAITVDNTPPSVSITFPAPGSTVAQSATTTITASASDNMSISKVIFYVNNLQKCVDSVSPYACAWRVPANTSSTSSAAYALKAAAYDLAGNVSSTIPFTVYAQ